MDEKEELHLTSQELQVLSELDSRQFGFLKLRGSEHGRTRALVLKAVKYLEGMLVQVKEEERALSPGDRRDICIDPKTYCKLGHFHLLLEDYAKAMSAYQKFYALEQDNWKDPLFLYGLGLCYYHYNAFEWPAFTVLKIERPAEQWGHVYELPTMATPSDTRTRRREKEYNSH